MVGLDFRKARHGYVAIADRLHFEDLAPRGNRIKGRIGILQQSKYFHWLSIRAPLGKAFQVSKEQDGSLGKQVGNGNAIVGSHSVASIQKLG